MPPPPTPTPAAAKAVADNKSVQMNSQDEKYHKARGEAPAAAAAAAAAGARQPTGGAAAFHGAQVVGTFDGRNPKGLDPGVVFGPLAVDANSVAL